MATNKLPKRPEVLSLDPKSLEDVLDDILRVGNATGTHQKAEQLVSSLRTRITSVENTASLAARRPRVACLEWLDPLFYAGHWVPQMVELAGGEDCLAVRGAPSERVEWAQVLEQKPEVVVFLPCGFDVQRGLREVHLITQQEGWSELPAARESQAYVTNGSAYFSRSGPRLVDGLEILAEILHPELFSGMVPSDGAMRLHGEVFKVS